MSRKREMDLPDVDLAHVATRDLPSRSSESCCQGATVRGTWLDTNNMQKMTRDDVMPTRQPEASDVIQLHTHIIVGVFPIYI